MKSNTFTISDLFSANKRYVVPLFQRPYVWDAASQWVPLWEDIVQKTDEIVNPLPGQKHQPRSHFMGAVVLNNIPVYGKQIPAMDVIDGQQRITTLQILFTAFRDIARNAQFDDVYMSLRQLTENGRLREQETEKYKVWPTTTDRRVFEDIMTSGSAEKLATKYPLQRIKRTRRYYPRSRLVEAYLYFSDAISAYITDSADTAEDIAVPFAEAQATESLGEGMTEELEQVRPDEQDARGIAFDDTRVYGLMETLTKHLELVVIELEDRDDPQVIFETLNARGVPLLPSDLIRNFIFLNAARLNLDTTSLYQTYWQPLDQPDPVTGDTWKRETRAGRLRRPLIDLFFFYYLTYQTGREMLMQHVFQEYRVWWKEKAPEPEIALQSIEQHSRLFKRIYEGKGNTRLDVFGQRLRLLDVSTVYPLLLFLTSGEKGLVSDTELNGMIVDIESFVVRRLICNLTNKGYNRLFVTMINKLRAEPVLTRAALQRILLDQQGDSGRWPGDDDFHQAWITNPVYDSLGAGRVQVILEALDQHLIGKMQENVRDFTKFSIEHVMPQNGLDADWPLPVENDATPEAIEGARARRRALLHTFGNLTTLTEALNSSLQNGPFVNKRPKITANSQLRLNVYFQDFAGKFWNETEIVNRGNALFTVAKKVWPRPE